MQKSGISDIDFGTLSRCWHRLVGRIFEGEISQKAIWACLEEMTAGNAVTMLDSHRRLIDCDVAPHVQDGWKILEEDQPSGAVRGKIYFNAAKIILRPLNDLGPAGLGAVVLDCLMANKYLIPETWFNGVHGLAVKVVFPATVYRLNGEALYRVLYISPSTCGYASGFVPIDYEDRAGHYMAAHLTV